MNDGPGQQIIGTPPPVHPAGSVGPQTPPPGVLRDQHRVLEFDVYGANHREIVAALTAVANEFFGDSPWSYYYYARKFIQNQAGDTVSYVANVEVRAT